MPCQIPAKDVALHMTTRLKRPPKTELNNGEEHVPKGISIEKGVGGDEGERNEGLRAKEEKGCGLRDCTGSWFTAAAEKQRPGWIVLCNRTSAVP